MNLLLAIAFVAALDSAATDSVKEEGFVFTTRDSVGITPVKNQNQSGTCWAFSAIGFFESEVMRANKGKQVDMAEMFVVSKTMQDRAEYCVRMYGDVAFAGGGSGYDVLYCLKNYGMVPQSAMPQPGTPYGWTEADTLPNHNELDAVAKGFLSGVTKQKRVTRAWKTAFRSIYDAYLGECPESFVYEGKQYTPQEWVKSLGIDADDYVTITSYTHHPFYTQFPLEVPDNWRMDPMYNVPMDEMMMIIDNAIKTGYTLEWSADVSEVGFTRKGIGVMPDADKGADLTGSDMAHWLGLSKDDRKAELTKKPLPEMEITQQMRQDAYDNYETTDDHGMQIFGIATDQNGKEYYMVKNSWGTQKSTYKGIWYISRAFMAYKTNAVMVNKNAIPTPLRRKMGIR